METKTPVSSSMLSIKVPDELLNAFKKSVKDDGRNVSATLRRLMEQYIESSSGRV